MVLWFDLPHSRPAPVRVMAAMALLMVLLAPDSMGTVSAQEPSASEERDAVRQRQGEVDLEADALESDLDDVTTALETLAVNVEDQSQELDEAERAASDAEDDLVAAEQAVAEAEERIEVLEAATGELMVAAYVNPPTATTFAALSSDTMSDATVKEVLLELQTDTNADVFDELAEAQEDLEIEKASKEAIAEEAETKRAAAETALTSLRTAYAQQQTFAADAEQALELKLAESAALAERDATLSEQIAAEEAAALAAQLEAARQRQQQAPPSDGGGGGGGGGGGAPAPGPAPAPAAAAPATISEAPGGLATVSCPQGGSITVAGEMSSNLSGLLDAAGADGVGLCGWGWRDPSRQIALRQQNCGGDVYNAPSSSCSPPTARPGTSQHEVGLAVDFTCDGATISSRGSKCFQWLANNAGRFGLSNLPSEPWHWSTTGR